MREAFCQSSCLHRFLTTGVNVAATLPSSAAVLQSRRLPESCIANVITCRGADALGEINHDAAYHVA